MRLTIALGGNALLDPDDEPSHAAQAANIRNTAERLAGLIEEGHELVIVHGNGPQAGSILLQQEETPPEMPLDVVVAETQGQIGYMLQRALDQELQQGDEDRRAVTVLTQVVVDEDAEAFDHPFKPVGPFYTEAEAREKPFETKEVGTGDRRWRRVVPSPEPVDIMETDTIRSVLESRDAVIACGGGGVPVSSSFEGMEAVIDKDRSAALLAEELDADRLVILTNVDHAYLEFGTPQQEAIEELSVARARELVEDSVFGEGTMRPKIEAAAAFAERTGKPAVIGSLEHIDGVLDDDGTVIGDTDG